MAERRDEERYGGDARHPLAFSEAGQPNSGGQPSHPLAPRLSGALKSFSNACEARARLISLECVKKIIYMGLMELKLGCSIITTLHLDAAAKA